MAQLVWFRKDLRVHDHSALTAACTAADKSGVVALFIITPETWQAHHVAACQIDFLLQNLRLLQKELATLNIPLLVRTTPKFQDIPELLAQLTQQHNISNIYFNNQYELDEHTRDQRVTTALTKLNCTVHRFDDTVLIAPEKLKTQADRPYTVYTPFKNAWLKYIAAHPTQYVLHPKPKPQAVIETQSDAIPDNITGFKHVQDITWCNPGAAAAKKVFTAFLEHNIEHYADARNFPAIHGTSQLSPYLNLGIMSARQCAAPLLEFLDYHHHAPQAEGQRIWLQELIWREFYQGVIFNFPQVCRGKPFKTNTDKLPWQYDPQLLTAWQQGQTGFPIVDAGMRQLNQTGWMHNRVRMICAMFLSKNLLLDWRLGEHYFSKQLLDGDFAANNGGWQWCASTGTDAVPYFRIFNPTEQSKRFDPNGDYLRHYCPELANLDNHDIHNPPDLFRGDYPLPIIDYKSSRERVLAAFKSLC
jgi:deoxyribodipyrimidine photo-lyase